MSEIIKMLNRAADFAKFIRTLPWQLTRSRLPRGAQDDLLSAALFPTWHGSQGPVAQDLNLQHYLPRADLA